MVDVDEAVQLASVDGLVVDYCPAEGGGEVVDDCPAEVGGEVGDDDAVVEVVVDDVGGLQITAAGSLGTRAGRYVVAYLSVQT